MEPSIRPRVLVADDEPHILQAIRLKLERAGFDVDLATNGEEAVRRAFASPPDIVIADIRMPVKNGYELCRELQADERLRRVPVILLTAHAVAIEREKAGSIRVDEFLTKPFSPLALVGSVRAVLARTAVA